MLSGELASLCEANSQSKHPYYLHCAADGRDSSALAFAQGRTAKANPWPPFMR
jgi:hypothetical protein